jgi:very-short-patch-repair endonuclease
VNQYRGLVERCGPTAARAALRAYLDKHDLQHGTLPEEIAARQLHRWGVPFVQQHRVGRYRLDFAVLATRVAIEIDGPHHWRPDVAVKDVARDAYLREQGWIVLRVTAEDDDQLLRAAIVAKHTPEVTP